MALIINTNITSSLAQNNLAKAGDSLQSSIQRLSSGLRVNNASDDASGYAIANRMDSQVRGMAVATRNANDAISFSQTASGALSQISNDLQRMRELAVQAANGSNSSSDTSLLNQEFSQLQIEVSRIQGSTTFNNVSVFTAADTVMQIGANTSANDLVNMQGNALTTTMTLGTQTITDRTATTATADISSAITTANAITGASVLSIYNATVDAINASQKLSFAAKTDALDTIQTLYNAYNNPAVVGNTVGNFATDAISVLSMTNPGTQVNLLISSVGTSGSIFQADAAGNGAKFIKFTNASALACIVGATANGVAAGQLGASQTASAGQINAQSAITALDNALTEVNAASAVQGALQNRFSAVISNLAEFSKSQTSAKSRIVDADFAEETAKLSKNQILQQAGTAMLAQANQIPSTVLSLLK